MSKKQVISLILATHVIHRDLYACREYLVLLHIHEQKIEKWMKAIEKKCIY